MSSDGPESMRNMSRHLDPDIACKRSWSLNVKIHEQPARRNYERNMASLSRHQLVTAGRSRPLEDQRFKWPCENC